MIENFLDGIKKLLDTLKYNVSLRRAFIGFVLTFFIMCMGGNEMFTPCMGTGFAWAGVWIITFLGWLSGE